MSLVVVAEAAWRSDAQGVDLDHDGVDDAFEQSLAEQFIAQSPIWFSSREACAAPISWLNSDNTTHTSKADGDQWSSSDIPPGGRFNFTFASAGRYAYHCQIHPNMTGTIVVQ